MYDRGSGVTGGLTAATHDTKNPVQESRDIHPNHQGTIKIRAAAGRLSSTGSGLDPVRGRADGPAPTAPGRRSEPAAPALDARRDAAAFGPCRRRCGTRGRWPPEGQPEPPPWSKSYPPRPVSYT